LSQALPGYLITAPPSVCDPAVIGALAVWIQNQKNNQIYFTWNFTCAFESGASGLPYYCTPPVCVPDVLGALAVWRQNMKKKALLRAHGGRQSQHFRGLQQQTNKQTKGSIENTIPPGLSSCHHVRFAFQTRPIALLVYSQSPLLRVMVTQ